MKHARVLTALALPFTLALGACGEAPTAPGLGPDVGASFNHGGPHGRPQGSGLTLNSLTDVTLPLLGDLGDALIVDQVVITNLTLVENAAGQIIGLEATGTVIGELSSALGVKVEEQFTSTVNITSSGPGKCDLLTVDLGGLNIDALGLVTADVPAAQVSSRGSGAVGSLLCNLGSLVGGLVGGGAGGLVNAINNQI